MGPGRGGLAALVGRRRARTRAADGVAATGERCRRIAEAMHAHQVAAEILERLDLDPGGVSDRRVPAGERLFFVVDGVALVEPGIEAAPSVVVADGQLVVTDRALRFRSERTEVEWPLDRLTGQVDGGRWVRWAGVGTEGERGVGGSRAAAVAARAGTLWGQGRIAEARACLSAVLEQTRREIADLRAEYAPKPRLSA